jgi:uncharacterized Zn finger protein
VDFWKPYVSVAERQRKAAAEAQRLSKKGKALDPVVIDGRTIARTFWGKAWCDNLERYSDFATRLPRGRSYARNGSVIDLQIAAGEVSALVSGSSLYRVAIRITAVDEDCWAALGKDCAGAIDSLVALLQGTLSAPIMERVTRAGTGLFPTPSEIELDCTCPDWADMCKHVAAVLYGVGARLDRQPELLFALRGVDEKELIASAGQGGSLTASPPSARVLVGGGLAELFGIELATFTGATDDAGTAADGRPAPRRSTAKRMPASTAAPKAVPRTRPTASSRVTSTAIASAKSAADATKRTATRATRPSVDATPQRRQPPAAPAGARGVSAGPAVRPPGTAGRTGAAARAIGSTPASTGPTGAAIRAAARAAGIGTGSVATGGTVPDAKRRGGAAATSRSATRPAASATKRKRPTSVSKPR